MINKETRANIKGYLEGFIQGMINEHKENGFDPKKLRPLRDSSKDGELKPFHESLLPDGLLKIAEFERSFSTKLGTTFEECAKIIAKANHSNAERSYRIKGVVSKKAIKYIEEITSEVGDGTVKSDFPKFIKEVVKLSKKDAGVGETRTCIADVYIQKKNGQEYFFEIKSPKPNKGQCLEVTSRLLQIQSIKHSTASKTKTYFAMAYNPYGFNKEEYKHSFAKQYLDLNNQVVIGKEFWDIVGGDGTYEEVLSIYKEVGKEKGPDMLDQLALGY